MFEVRIDENGRIGVDEEQEKTSVNAGALLTDVMVTTVA